MFVEQIMPDYDAGAVRGKDNADHASIGISGQVSMERSHHTPVIELVVARKDVICRDPHLS